MQRIDELLDKAIRRIKNGESASAVISDSPEELQDQLRAMLEIVGMVSSLQTIEVPTPNKRRLYLKANSPVSAWMHFGELLKTWKVAPITLGIFFLTAAATAFGAASALPGDGVLFQLKKTVQTARVNLASDPQERARLQLELAEQRIQEAQKVLASNDPSKKQKAIEEVQQQTSVALNDLKESGTGITNSSVAKAENIAKAQQSIVAQVDPQAAQQSKQENKVALREIQSLLATSNEESGTSLAPAKIDITGSISAIDGNNITVNKNVYVVDDATTEIKDKDGNDLLLSDLEVNDVVKITGKVTGEKNIADNIVVLNKLEIIEPDAQKSDNSNDSATSKDAPKQQPKAKKTIIKIDLQPQAEPQPTPIDPKPLDTHGGFIPEAPANF